MKNSFEQALEAFRENHGLLLSSKAKKLGIDYKTVSEMEEAGLLVRESRGLYRLASQEPTSYPDLVHVALRVPAAVICLTSALAFHELTTQIPHRVFIALPSTKHKPQITYPPLDVIWLTPKPYAAGIETHKLDSVPVRIYSKEKTVADCFKFRNKIGYNVALEALKDYMRQPNKNIPELLACARIDRVEKLMLPLIQATT